MKAAFHISSDEGLVIDKIVSDTQIIWERFPRLANVSIFLVHTHVVVLHFHPLTKILKLPEVFSTAFQPHGASTRHCPLLFPVPVKITAPRVGAAGAPTSLQCHGVWLFKTHIFTILIKLTKSNKAAVTTKYDQNDSTKFDNNYNVLTGLERILC